MTHKTLINTIRVNNFDKLKQIIDSLPELINSKGERGFIPLLFASYFGEIKTIEYLLTKDPYIGSKMLQVIQL